MTTFRSLLALTVLAGITLAAGTFLRTSQNAQTRVAEQQAQRSIQTHTVGRGQVEESISALGSVEATAVVDVSFQTAGTVAEVLVSTGDYVYAGTPLARLENISQEIDYQQALLALERATLYLEDLLGPIDEDDIRIAEAEIQSARASYTSAASRVSDADIQAAELRYQQELENYQALQEARRVSGGLDEREIAQLEAEIGQASFNTEIARLELESLRNNENTDLYTASARIAQAERELEQLLAGPSQAEINSAEVALQRAEAALRDAELALNRTTLVSPVDGVVTGVDIEVGQPVSAGVTVIEVTDRSELQLIASVDETDVAKLEAGMPAYVQLDAVDGDIPARVTQVDLIGTEVSNVVSYSTRLALETTDPRVRVGMTGEAFIVTAQVEDAIVVPNNFLQVNPATSTATVEVLQPGGDPVSVEVAIGLQGESQTEIVSGLSEGDIIVAGA